MKSREIEIDLGVCVVSFFSGLFWLVLACFGALPLPAVPLRAFL